MRIGRTLLPRKSPTRWDASVDLTPAVLPQGFEVTDEMICNVALAVGAIPGARLVSVEIHADAPAHLPWVAVCAAGSAHPLTGREWDDRVIRIEEAVRTVIDGVG